MMQEYLNDNFLPVYRKYLVFLEKDHIGKLESTNKLENYFVIYYINRLKEFMGLLKEYLIISWQKILG